MEDVVSSSTHYGVRGVIHIYEKVLQTFVTFFEQVFSPGTVQPRHISLPLPLYLIVNIINTILFIDCTSYSITIFSAKLNIILI